MTDQLREVRQEAINELLRRGVHEDDLYTVREASVLCRCSRPSFMYSPFLTAPVAINPRRWLGRDILKFMADRAAYKARYKTGFIPPVSVHVTQCTRCGETVPADLMQRRGLCRKCYMRKMARVQIDTLDFPDKYHFGGFEWGHANVNPVW